jgi:alkylation response protein AidB-like acyl-CoA dehydrogenase
VDLALSEEQQELISAFAGLFGRTSFPEQVRAAEPAGFDASLWHRLTETGVLAMAVPEQQLGWGASMLDLGLVAEEAGRWLVPAPVIECQITARLLAKAGSAFALETLTSVLAGTRLVTLALRPPRSGVATLVPGGAVCDALVVLEDEHLVLVPTRAERRHPVANLGSAPLADVSLGGGTELASGAAASDAFESALDEWLVLTASALVGMGTASHEIVCRYTAERRAFGGVIGGYQGVAHPLAEDATRLDGARLLARKAAWALDTSDQRAPELAALAFAYASRTAERATYRAIHFHGGYGFMLEHDVQLYYRRARGWARVWGSADDAYRRAATARYGTPHRRSA